MNFVSDDDAWGKHSSNGHRINVPLICLYHTFRINSDLLRYSQFYCKQCKAKPLSWSLKSGHKRTPPQLSIPFYLSVWHQKEEQPPGLCCCFCLSPKCPDSPGWISKLCQELVKPWKKEVTAWKWVPAGFSKSHCTCGNIKPSWCFYFLIVMRFNS